jgi:hypothetical protein
MELSPSRESASCAATQDLPNILQELSTCPYPAAQGSVKICCGLESRFYSRWFDFLDVLTVEWTLMRLGNQQRIEQMKCTNLGVRIVSWACSAEAKMRGAVGIVMKTTNCIAGSEMQSMTYVMRPEAASCYSARILNATLY